MGAVQIWFESVERHGPGPAMLSVTRSGVKHHDVTRFVQMLDTLDTECLDDRARFNSNLAGYVEMDDWIGRG